MATHAIMTLLRDGNILVNMEYIPKYRVVTWSTYETEGLNQRALEADMRTIQSGPMASGRVFAVWTAPFDETRFTIPTWARVQAAAAGIHISN
jgi:enoyl-[acyl-carrier-protein] reductase (NADH)